MQSALIVSTLVLPAVLAGAPAALAQAVLSLDQTVRGQLTASDPTATTTAISCRRMSVSRCWWNRHRGCSTPISWPGLGARQGVEQQGCALVVAHPAFRQQHGDRSALAVADRGPLGVQTALVSPDAAGNIDGI